MLCYFSPYLYVMLMRGMASREFFDDDDDIGFRDWLELFMIECRIAQQGISVELITWIFHKLARISSGYFAFS